MLELFKVTYSEDIPKNILFEAMLMKERFDSFTSVITTKSIEWAYENEFRLILWDRPNKGVKLTKNTIVKIILGCRTDDNKAKEILNFIRQTKLNISVFKAEQEQNKVGLLFNKLI